jgi:hypothetical protein
VFLRKFLGFMMEFLAEFLVEFLVDGWSSSGDGCEVRDGDGWSGCGCVCAVERLGRGVLRASPFIAVFGCLCCGVEE